mgnify:CR=1 FL=1
MFDVVLVRPEIPPNTGNAIRLCANTGARLHLVEPLGFRMGDAEVKRAGLDYHEMTVVTVHPDLDACLAALAGRRAFALTTKANAAVHDVAFRPGDVFVFGSETKGLPDDVLERFDASHRLRLPMVPGNRSINLSNAVAVTVFEAWRQNGFAGSGR